MSDGNHEFVNFCMVVAAIVLQCLKNFLSRYTF